MVATKGRGKSRVVIRGSRRLARAGGAGGSRSIGTQTVPFSGATMQTNKRAITVKPQKELKRHYREYVNQDLGTLTATQRLRFLSVPFIVQGLLGGDRVGNLVKAHRLNCRIQVANRVGVSNYVRVAVLRERFHGSMDGVAGPPTVAQLAALNLLVDGTATPRSIDSSNDPKSQFYKWNYSMCVPVYNRVFKLSALGTNQDMFTKTISLKLNRILDHNGPAGADVISSQYYFIVFGSDRLSSTAASDAIHEVSMYTTLYYTDM